MKRSSARDQLILPIFLVAIVSIVAALPGLRNGFTYDDFQVIVENPDSARSISLPRHLQKVYPPGDAYRPLTMWAFSLQWRASGGDPQLFHLASLLMSAAASCLVLLLARRLLPRGAALAAALIFAVHPVHVEAVASIVGQAEVLMTLLLVTGVLVALPGSELMPGPLRLLMLLACAAMAPLAKEQGFMLAPLLGTVLFLWPMPPTAPPQSRKFTWAALALLPAVFVFLLRASVVGGVSTGPLAALVHASLTERVLIVLGLVPEWGRLLLWPVRLQLDYSQPEVGMPGPGSGQLLGLAVLAAALALAWWARRRAPALTIGIAWVAITLLPVSNLIVPTGIFLAERTLFLPSVGSSIALSAAGALAWASLPRARPVIVAVLAVAIVLGSWWSSVRTRAWKDNNVLFADGVSAGPRSHRAYFIYGSYLAASGRLAEAESALRRSLELWEPDPEAYEQLTRLLRREDRCEEAVGLLKAGLRHKPDHTVMRSRLVECYIEMGRLDEADLVASDGATFGDPAAAAMRQRVESAFTAPKVDSSR